MPSHAPPSHVAPFFALRTPLLPIDALSDWAAGLAFPAARDAALDALDRGDTPADQAALERALESDLTLLKRRLSVAFQDPVLAEAVFTASPSVGAALDNGGALNVENPEWTKLDLALARYYIRMASRPTPFGLLAGWTVGQSGTTTRFELGPRREYRRATRVDMDVITAHVGDLLTRCADSYDGILTVNTSLYAVADRFRYAEARAEGGGCSYHLVEVTASDAVQAVVRSAARGAERSDLHQTLVQLGATDEEANGLLGAMIAAQILVPDFVPGVSGVDPVDRLLASRVAAAESEYRKQWAGVQHGLHRLDEDGLGATPARYAELTRRLANAAGDREVRFPFQVDLVKPGDVTLGTDVQADMLTGVRVLQRLSMSYVGELDSFRAAFRKRYDRAEVPLLEALDDEIGIGYVADERTAVPGRQPGERGSMAREDRGAIEAILQHKVMSALQHGHDEICLEPGDLPMPRSGVAPLPGAFAVAGAVLACQESPEERGELRVLVNTVSGPSGATLLGRISHAVPGLTERIREHLRAEEALAPDAVFAEVAHLPEGRVGNVLRRPVLRDFEIPYLSNSDLPDERLIPLDDLVVALGDDDRVVLRSRRLQREVRPRLTNAHTFTAPRNLPVYRFLCALQLQQVSHFLTWSWGTLQHLPTLPRVRMGRVILARAQWRVDHFEIKRLLAAPPGAARHLEVERWRRERRLPTRVLLTASDNQLLVDFENPVCVESFVAGLRGVSAVFLTEALFSAAGAVACGPEGAFVNELIVPFEETASTLQPSPANGVASRPSQSALPRPQAEAKELPPNGAGGASLRSYAPGSEWLYAKIFVGPSGADDLLAGAVADCVAWGRSEGIVDRWFFIRYPEDGWHLRVRFHGSPQRLSGELLPAMHRALQPAMRAGIVSRLQLDTYEREIERYGGTEAIESVERLFSADSDAALLIVSQNPGDDGLVARWRFAAASVDRLLSDFGLELSDRRRLLLDTLARRPSATPEVRRRLGVAFRQERVHTQPYLRSDAPRDAASTHNDDGSLHNGLSALATRSLVSQPAAERLQRLSEERRLHGSVASIAMSLAHMSVNRLLRVGHEGQETALYDFLERWYHGLIARGITTVPANHDDGAVLAHGSASA